MSTFATRTSEDRNRRNAEQAEKASKNDRAHISIEDNRPAAAAQRVLGEALGSSSRVQSQVQMKHAIDQSPRVSQMKRDTAFAGPTIQRAGPEEELQLKAAPIQRAGPEEELQLKAAPIQRAGPEEELQLKAAPIQRAGPEEELQLKAAPIQRAGEEEPMQGKFTSEKKNDTGLPDGLKAGVEQLSGLSLDGVKVHYNSPDPAQVQALAYTQGNDIHVGPGQEQHLPHEAWHVTQQRSGRVQPTMQAAGLAINDDQGLEHEADVMGARALQTKPDPAVVSRH